MTRRPRYTCSFYGMTQEDTRRMIAGPQPHAALICAACVHLCTALLAQGEQEATQHTAPHPRGQPPPPSPPLAPGGVRSSPVPGGTLGRAWTPGRVGGYSATHGH